LNFNIVTSYPAWFIIFCILAGLVYAFVLYYRERKLEELPKWLRYIMAFFRFLVVTIIAFLLLSPLLKTELRETEKPVIVIAQDNSESIVLSKDSAFYRNEYRQKLNKLAEELGDKYEVRRYTFGDRISSESENRFNEKQTDISSVFEEIDTRFSNRNLGAVIIASDGLYNKGVNPVYSSSKLRVPVYTIALGDTNVKKDIVLNKVLHNRLAYLGNTFPLEVLVDARELKGKTSTLTVSKGNQTLFTQNININSSSFVQTVPVLLEAKEPGLQRYRVKLSTVPEEVNFNNNVQDIFIEVMDAREKILLLTDGPHPDVAAIKQSIEGNQNYEVEAYMLSDFDKPLKQYNLVVINQLPSTTNATTKIISDINAAGLPVLYILGAKTNLAAFSNLQTGVSITGNGARANESEAVVNASFPLFTLSDELKNYTRHFPALQTPFGTYRSTNSANILMSQKIGVVETKDPLIVFNQSGDRKTGVITGEGLWRWRLRDFADHGNHDIFNELISKTIQYLSVKVDKSLFRVTTKSNYYENEPVEFEAEVYNESYELINEPEVSITITNADKKTFPFTFSKTSNAYRLNAGLFAVGEYKYEARVKVGEKVFTQRGEFSVSPLMVEAANTVADHQVLYSLAKKHGGDMVYPAQLEKLQELLTKREDIKTVSYTEKKLNDLVNLKWVFFLLLGLLSVEWFLRKRNGAY
jgi:hypothetical protein